MARYDVYADPEGLGLLLDVQTDLLEGFDTRLVAPLLRQPSSVKPIKRLNPIFEIGVDTTYVMAPQLLVAVPESILREKKANLAHHHDEIIAALDMIFHGF